MCGREGFDWQLFGGYNYPTGGCEVVFSRQLALRTLISHRFPLEQTAVAVDLTAKPMPDLLKVLVTVAGTLADGN